MCGIAGVFRRGAVRGPIDAALLERMSTRLAHRGPDGQGIYVDPTATVGLVHRRLAIVDLSDTASQPMTDATGRIRVSYNGEIYNHQVLRAALVQAGYQFKTDHSDTEVLVHGYAHWGLDGLLNRLAGMFALSLWDAKTRELWLVRDRVGIKPLYFTQARQDIVFASEIKALLEHPGVSRQISRAAVSHYLSFWQTPAPLTMFEGIYKIPAGHRVRITQEHGVEMSRYWDVTSRSAEVPGDIERWPEAAQETFYVDGVLKRLRHSVGEHMMSDVPYGAFLSGGVDSSTNVALMREFTDRPINTFTVGFSDHTHLNELDEARQIATHFGTRHHEVLIDQAHMWEYLDQLIYSQDEPIADWVCIPLYFVSKLARDNGMIVMQVGEGADEEFSGYDGYLAYLKAFADYWTPFRRYCPGPLAGVVASLADHVSWRSPRHAHRLDMVSRAARNRELFWSNCHVFTDNLKNRLVAPGRRRVGRGDGPSGRSGAGGALERGHVRPHSPAARRLRRDAPGRRAARSHDLPRVQAPPPGTAAHARRQDHDVGLPGSAGAVSRSPSGGIRGGDPGPLQGPRRPGQARAQEGRARARARRGAGLEEARLRRADGAVDASRSVPRPRPGPHHALGSPDRRRPRLHHGPAAARDSGERTRGSRASTCGRSTTWPRGTTR